MELSNLLVLNIINSGISFIMGLYMLFMQKNSAKLGTGYWGAGAIVIGFGLFFKAIFPINSFFALVGTPTFTTIGLYLYLAGILKFKGKKIKKWFVVGLPALDIIQSMFFYGIVSNYRIQIGIHLTILIVYCLLAIVEMIRFNADQKYLRKIFLFNALSFVVFLLLIVLNLAALIVNPDFKLFETSNYVIFLYLFSGLIMIALTFGFLTAVNVRLNRELEDQVKSNKKFLSIIAHDLRGPMGNIASFLDLLQNETGLSEKEKKEYLSVINVLSQSTFHLLQNLLEWATKSKNLNQYKRKRIDISELLFSNIDFFKSSTILKSIDLKFESGEQVFVSGDANMLQTVVRNLVSNAIKFTPERGTITLTSVKIKDKVRLIVSDTGKGIKPDVINSLFKFETNTSTVGTGGEVGSGLGLVLCKELVLGMNGIIEVKSQPGVGTRVIVEFPSID